ncbi:MAG TPA: carbamoyltransferase HypF [Desulfuromonadales bacterium]|nr:carbamoyltransferase HypF [Desulfuromonadales bacterium]
MGLIRKRYKITGIVQGVGFRPFVYRLAHERQLSGWVRNSPAGVEIEVEGLPGALAALEHTLATGAPPLADISSITSEEISPCGDTGFGIRESSGGEPDVQIAPDSAICGDCLREMFDPADRRYRYPFITCTNCGPRYSIITGIPYDRLLTTMSGFPLCVDCRREYDDPLNRRFHAQPVACHVCGPQVTLPGLKEEATVNGDAAIRRAQELLDAGLILAVKGIGGYHLAVDACNHQAVARLRERKKRDEKPFAIMVADLESARRLALLDDTEEKLLSSSESPIVIVRKRPDSPLSPLVAPGNGWLGLMLPYSPLHHLVMRDRFSALVMTSGNVSDEPVAFNDGDAVQRLSEIADRFLVHDRPIHIRSDDSVMRVFRGQPLFYRRARGYAPRAVKLPFAVPPLLATGADLKSTICLASGRQAVPSQHIGDLHNASTCDSFRHTIDHLSKILQISPELVACDLHPDYQSSIIASEYGLPLAKVQHHHAHLASCMAENGLDGEVIGVIFDGTGFGDDGTIWGGEFLTGGYDGYRRAAHFRPVPLPGGDAAVREPWRMALSYLYQALGEAAFSLDHPLVRSHPGGELTLFAQMLKRGINSPLTSSCGRLFDAVAALLGVRRTVSYEGQAAIELEALAETAETECKSTMSPLSQGGSFFYTFEKTGNAAFHIDFSPMFREILNAIASGTSTATIAGRFHITLAAATTEVCQQISRGTGFDRVVLSGGVFQNRLLSEMVYTALHKKGFQVFTHRLVPPNDGGIALGQAAIAGKRKV